MGRKGGDAGDGATKSATRRGKADKAAGHTPERARAAAALPIGGVEQFHRFKGPLTCPQCGAEVAPGVRSRSDGFTPAKRKLFLETLAKTGCVADGARIAGVSRNTAMRWRDRDEVFGKACQAALEMASSNLETLAWERAVTGIEEPVWSNGKLVGTRTKRSDSIFQLLLTASNKKKFGWRGGSANKAPTAKQRKRIEAEVRAEMTLSEPSREQLVDELKLRLMSIEARLCGGPEPMSLDDPAYHAWKEARSRREREGRKLIERMEGEVGHGACLPPPQPL